MAVTLAPAPRLERHFPIQHHHRPTRSLKEEIVMSLITDIRPKPLTATLHYLKRGAEKPTRYVEDPPPGVPQWNGIDDPRPIGIEDARGREGEFTLDRNGFQLVKAASHVGDFY